MYDKTLLKWALSGSYEPLDVLQAAIISLERLKLESSNLVHTYYATSSVSLVMTNSPDWCGECYVIHLKIFWP